jgi:hypothetical protein
MSNNSPELAHSFHELLWDAAWLWTDEPYSADQITVAWRCGAFARWLRTDNHTLRRRLQRLSKTGRVSLGSVEDELWIEGALVSRTILTLTVANPDNFSSWNKQYAACRECGETSRPHESNGWCSRCFQQVTKPYKPTRPKVMKQPKPKLRKPDGSVIDIFLTGV